MTESLLNTKVRYKANPDIVGWVVGLDATNARVFIDGSVKLVPVAEIEPAPNLVEMEPAAFKVALTRRRLEHPLTEQLLSYKASRTQLFYHQFLPVKKILESPDQRLLLADEVGIGKTIEAGLIWAELEARAPYGLQNVWVICPKSLMGKWQEEMIQRFDLRLEQLTSESLRQALVALERDGVLPQRFAQAVVNIELLRAEEHVSRLGNTSIAWDFVIFDEAHHLRNPETYSFALARFVCERAKAAVFLTATPFQTGLEDIVHLMEALGVDIAADPHLLGEQIRWDMQLNDCIRMIRHRAPGWEGSLPGLLDSLESSGGADRPGWQRFKELASTSNPNDAHQRAAVVQAARDIQVLSPYMARTLRGEVDTRRPTREAITRVVDFNPAELAFYDQVYRICLDRARAMGVPPGFATQMPERRTASCAPAVAAEILSSVTEAEDEEHRARFTRDELRSLEPYARDVIGSKDSKYDALVELLRHTFGELKADRAMVFSTFRGTLAYLAERLAREGFSLQVLHGGTPAADEDCRPGEKSRREIAADFRKGEFQVLLASEVAGEGLDFEHCHVLINYDLPWNPMRVEQRIGRCDRLGQQSEKIYIGSLASVGTIEQRILSRLYERLNVFERALGDMEIILGEEIGTFESDVFRLGLSSSQQEERLDRVAEVVANVERQRESISESSDLFLAGRQLLDGDQQEITEAESLFLSPEELSDFVFATLDGRFGQAIRRLDGALFEVTGNRELKDALHSLLRSYPVSHHARTEILRFTRRLDEGRVRLAFTPSEVEAEFAHIRHPLVLLARWLAREPLPDVPYCRGTSLSVQGPTLVVWAVGSLEGYTQRVQLLCAAVDSDSGDVTPLAPEAAQDWMSGIGTPLGGEPAASDRDALVVRGEQSLVSQFEQLSAAFNARNALLHEKASRAVTSHADRKVRWLDRQLARSDLKDNIRNLYRGWRQRLESETRSKLDELDQKSAVRSSLQVIGLTEFV
ncbi:MAG: hypothetical protein EPO65_09270 [Dehalococcoidia bacterium]|nr:MAG: hypothetical protein EPO65_09270 [Dehalococcoidia bacterium]